MLKKFLLFGFVSAITMTSFSSCENDDNDDPTFNNRESITVAEADLAYNSEGIWDVNDKDQVVILDNYRFSHFLSSGIVVGFTPSRITDNAVHDPFYEFPYASISGGGIGGNKPYLVGYWASFVETDEFGSRTCRIVNEEGKYFKPQSVMVNNTSWVYYSLLNGSAFSKKFGLGDSLYLVAHGVHPDGSESEVKFPLALITSNDVASGIVTKWTEFNLAALGVCQGMYFTMESTDSDPVYGMNTPAYFCMDRLIVYD